MRVTLTGGSGALGRALIPRLTGAGHTLTVFSRSEKAQLPLRSAYPGVRFLLGDVTDYCFCTRALADADLVVHAAALKHVDLSEAEPTAYTQTNVTGSLNVAEIATALGIRAVGISTDKACEPRNVYGLTKLVMERVFAEQGHVAIRYGNVLGSDGSVLEVWRRQLARDGRIAVTDPEMTRFYFPVEHSVDEVLWAVDNAPAGVVVVPRLRATRIGSLARAYLEAVGRPDAPIDVIGSRPGEKQHESLLSPREARWGWEIDGRVLFRPSVDGPGVAPIETRTAELIPHKVLVEWIRALQPRVEAVA